MVGGRWSEVGGRRSEVGRRKSEIGPREEAVDDAVSGEGGDAGGVGKTGGGDELVEFVGTAAVEAEPVIADLGLDKFDFAFGQQTLRTGKDVGLEAVDVDLEVIDGVDLMGGGYIIERMDLYFDRLGAVMANERGGIVTARGIHEETQAAALTAEGEIERKDVGDSICFDGFCQAPVSLRVRLDGDHSAALTDDARCQEGVEADVRADVEERVSGLEIVLDEAPGVVVIPEKKNTALNAFGQVAPEFVSKKSNADSPHPRTDCRKNSALAPKPKRRQQEFNGFSQRDPKSGGS